MWDLISDRLPAIPAPTRLRTEQETYDLIKARIEGYVEGYTEAFTATEKTKLGGIETAATADQTGSEIILPPKRFTCWFTPEYQLA